MNIDLFDDKYIDLLCPNGIEYIWGVYMHLDISDKDASKPNNKKIVLDVIETLMNYGVLYVYEWYKKPELNHQKLTIKETIDFIDEIWAKNSNYPDLYSMMYFGSPHWYVNKTGELGFTMTTNWRTFVHDKIGDLEKWIEENKP